MKRKTLILLFFIAEFTIFGQELYKSNVTASYYAEDFHGKKTSNGEKFNMYALTCAHKKLPFNTELKVTNLANGKSVIVRVNDRGPFVPDREIDLSKAAAVQLDMIGTGTTSVKLEIIKKGAFTKLSQQTAASADKLMTQRFGKNWDKGGADNTKGTGINSEINAKTDFQTKGTGINNAKPVKSRSYPPHTFWDIQVGAFSSRQNAEKRAKALSKAGFTNIVFQKTPDIIRVTLKEIPAEKVPEYEQKLQENGFTDYSIRQRKK